MSINYRNCRSVALILSVIAAFGFGIEPGVASELTLKPACAKQGQTVEIFLSDISSASGNQSFAAGPQVGFRGVEYKSFPLGKSKDYRTLIAVPADLDPGSYKVSCLGSEQILKVVSGGFPVQSIRLPKGKDTFDGSPGEKAAVDTAKQTVSPEPLWDGKFKRPCQARISAGYGLKRAVNGKLLKDYFHSGIDYAGFTGAQVSAAQSGRVILAHNGWKLHGNTVCIDHGQGVVSFYIHLSKIFVQQGQLVTPGQKIGAVGATGRANGPHLHFSLYVNGQAANPGDWFNKEY